MAPSAPSPAQKVKVHSSTALGACGPSSAALQCHERGS